ERLRLPDRDELSRLEEEFQDRGDSDRLRGPHRGQQQDVSVHRSRSGVDGLAPALLVPDRSAVTMIRLGREFFKMSGSGNDFVFVDARADAPGPLASPEIVGAICSRGTGIGADGVVFLEDTDRADVRLTYLNADGSRADLCGNATLCTARLARELGIVGAGEFAIETDSGVLKASFQGDRPEIDVLPGS